MSWLDRLRWGRKSYTAGTIELFREIYGSLQSAFGQNVTSETAMGVSAAFGCGRVIAQGMAQVPLRLMQKAGDARKPAEDHPLYRVMGERPNRWQTSYEYREQLSWHVEFCGSHYAYKNMVGREVRELIPFEPGHVTEKCEKGRIVAYKVRTADGGSEAEFPPEVIWHVRGPSWDGKTGLHVLRLARSALGLSLAMEQSQGRTFREGIQTTGIYSVEDKLNAPQRADLLAWLEKEYMGAKNAGKPMILDRAAKWTQTQMSSVDAQLRESRRDQIEEVCRYFGVLPIMIGFSDKTATFASAEAFFLAHVVHCLSPRWKRYEQSMNEFLLTEKDRQAGLYFTFVEEALIRGSTKDTKDALLGYVNGGLMTPNEARAKLDLNPDADPASNKLRLPVNVAQEPKKPDDADLDPAPA